MLNTQQHNKIVYSVLLFSLILYLVACPGFAHAQPDSDMCPVLDMQKQLELAVALHKNHDHDHAIALLDQLITYAPDNNMVFWYNKAYMLKTIGRPHEAIPCYQRVLARCPEHDHAHYGLAQAYLAAGDLERGFYHFQWRLAHRKKWENSIIPADLTGVDIVLRAEFGFGDMFQFIRYAHELKKRGCATITVQAFRAQVPLFKLCPYIDRVIEEYGPLPQYGLHIPLLSVPHLLGTTLDTIPAPIPYLHADSTLTEQWREKLTPRYPSSLSVTKACGCALNADGQARAPGQQNPAVSGVVLTKTGEASGEDRSERGYNFKIGICWQGKAQHFLEENPLTKRSVPLSLFAPLAAIPGVTLYSLQNGTGTDQLENIDFAVHTFGPDFDVTAGRFMDTAAVIKNMDLIISVDTSLVHLAGGLGAQTWVLIPYVPEWRWLEKRTDTPWYPEIMRLWRQPEPGNWHAVMTEITAAVRELIRTK